MRLVYCRNYIKLMVWTLVARARSQKKKAIPNPYAKRFHIHCPFVAKVIENMYKRHTRGFIFRDGVYPKCEERMKTYNLDSLGMSFAKISNKVAWNFEKNLHTREFGKKWKNDPRWMLVRLSSKIKAYNFFLIFDQFFCHFHELFEEATMNYKF